MKQSGQQDLQESIFNFTHTALDEDLLPVLENLSGNFVRFKH